MSSAGSGGRNFSELSSYDPPLGKVDSKYGKLSRINNFCLKQSKGKQRRGGEETQAPIPSLSFSDLLITSLQSAGSTAVTSLPLQWKSHAAGVHPPRCRDRLSHPVFRLLRLEGQSKNSYSKEHQILRIAGLFRGSVAVHENITREYCSRRGSSTKIHPQNFIRKIR